MKKYISLFIIFCLCFSLISCNEARPSDTEPNTDVEETKTESEVTQKPTEPPTEDVPKNSREEFDEYGYELSWSDVDPREAFDKLNVGMPYAEICELFGVEGAYFPTASGILTYRWHFDFEGEQMNIRVSFSRFRKDELSPDQDWVSTPDFMSGAGLYKTILKETEKVIVDWTKPSNIKVEKTIVMEEFHDKPYEYTEEYITDSIHGLFTNLETTQMTKEQREETSELLLNDKLFYKQIRFYYSDNTWQDFYLSSCGKYLTKRYFKKDIQVTASTYYIGETQAEMLYDAIYSLPIDEEHEYKPTEMTE